MKKLFAFAVFFISISFSLHGNAQYQQYQYQYQQNQNQQAYYQPQYQQQAQWVGIQSSRMNFVSASQKNSQWCWAAAIQMVLNYYGVAISQEQIVGRTYGTDMYGNLPNQPGSFQAITANLNNLNIDNYGRRYHVSASVNRGAPTPAFLLQELQQGRPVIVGYRSGPNSGHAVVITAAKFRQSYNGPIIDSVVVRDPWPSAQNARTRGRVEYPGSQLASIMQAYWYVRVQ